MAEWGNITEREGIDKLMEIIREISWSKPSGFVGDGDTMKPLMQFVKQKNPTMNDSEASKVASNIRGWLGSRYTQLDKVYSGYADTEKLLQFVRDFGRQGKPYTYCRRVVRGTAILSSANE